MSVALAGAVVMVSSSYGRGAMVGDLLAVVMATSFAVATVVVRRHPEIQMAPAAALATALTALVALPLAAPLETAPRDLALLAFFGVGSSARASCSSWRASGAVLAVHGRPRLPSTGVRWRAGLVVTANHTVEADREVTLTGPDGRTLSAQVAGRDPRLDIAVLRTDAESAPAADLADDGERRDHQPVQAV